MESATYYSHRREPFYFSSTARAIWILHDSPSPWQTEYRREKERIIAELCVDLIDRCGWYLSNIHIGELIPVISQSGWRYPEADILLTDGSGRPCSLIKVVPPKAYEQELPEAIRELFLLAHALRLEQSISPLSLVYCTRWHEKDSIKERVITIDYLRFETFEGWDAAGRIAGDSLPRRAVQK